MTLKAVVDSLDSVDEKLRDLYQQDGDKYRLSIEGVIPETEVSGLKSALQKERERARQLEKASKSYEGIDPEEYQRLRQEAEERQRKDAEKKGEFEKIAQQMREKHEKDINGWKDKTERLRKALESNLIDASATQELVTAKGVAPLLLPHVKAQVRVVEEDGAYQVRVVNAKGEPRVDGEGKYLTIKDLVAEMRQSDIYARAFEGSGATGSGTRSGQSSGRSGAKQITRKQFDSMGPVERANHFASGGTITD